MKIESIFIVGLGSSIFLFLKIFQDLEETFKMIGTVF